MLDLFNVLNVCEGVIGSKGIEDNIASIVHYIYLGIQVVVPILLIIFGMIELAKAITAQKEDEIKKAQSSFLKKLVLAVIVFLVFSIVKLVFNFAGGGDSGAESGQGSVWTCVDELIRGKSRTTTNVTGN